ncbi:MAG: hypothetical protein ACE1ZG_01920, partial [Gammaproteobacteria bacterium]
MTIQDKDKQFVDSIISELNESVQNINARDLSAITQSRNKALYEKIEKKPGWIFIPAGAFVTACLALVVYSFMQVTPDGQNLTQERLAQENLTQESVELVSGLEEIDYDEDPDIYEELKFHEWLDAYESS